VSQTHLYIGAGEGERSGSGSFTIRGRRKNEEPSSGEKVEWLTNKSVGAAGGRNNLPPCPRGGGEGRCVDYFAERVKGTRAQVPLTLQTEPLGAERKNIGDLS